MTTHRTPELTPNQVTDLLAQAIAGPIDARDLIQLARVLAGGYGALARRVPLRTAHPDDDPATARRRPSRSRIEQMALRDGSGINYVPLETIQGLAAACQDLPQGDLWGTVDRWDAACEITRHATGKAPARVTRDTTPPAEVTTLLDAALHPLPNDVTPLTRRLAKSLRQVDTSDFDDDQVETVLDVIRGIARRNAQRGRQDSAQSA